MKRIKVLRYDAFSSIPGKGNPAGVILNGDHLNEADMLELAKIAGFNETSFPVRSGMADFKMRYFTPGGEMDLCGHGTIAAIYALKENGLLGEKEEITIETKAGMLPIGLQHSPRGLFVTMKQAEPVFKPFTGSKADLMASIGLSEEDVAPDLPIVYGSTGNWTLLVPIKELRAFDRMVPHNQQFPDVLEEIPHASVHPFCLETYDPNADMHGRHFSSAFSGTIEDPVTGTASCVMGAYYVKYIAENAGMETKLIVEQGNEIGKEGQVHVKVTKDHNRLHVEMTGNAVFVEGFETIL
ncbi:PhzF family phenazine biosynthesis isomerase [Bacillus sp. FJAT-42376]|uniref:PhzF family phenazine biosynthesis isomerase n=1 Tax=Bacillus sp. FJAT-42376 TaxID=2014076 RepID=UPI000F50E9B6|nr:PhzF family phenazine biosynthesis isomerase [Bacillus sp. FJAT-42376]AZB41958.1 PhzF family phenazine biosynthesis isomerase [Bacillus sp. FJAT-42376]